jgi:hypothetical protein
MLKTGGKVTLLLKLRRWMCVCLPSRRMDPRLLTSIRPLRFGWLACWCDRAGSDGGA